MTKLEHMRRWDTILTSVELLGFTVYISTLTGLSRFRALIVDSDGREVADINWPGSPLGAADAARFEVLRRAGIDTYSVSLWGSRPGTDDDCWTGLDFETMAEARRCFDEPERFFKSDLSSAAWFALTREYRLNGTNYSDEMGVRENPSYDRARIERERRMYDEMERRERAMQAGMAFGVDGYNDEMGW